MKEITRDDVRYLGGCIYELYTDAMTVPAHVVAPEDDIESLWGDRSLQQLANVATLPGIQPYVWAMPDMHEGYGFPIGGVAATAIDEGGVISPGGIGYDINCGVRLLTTNIPKRAIDKNRDKLAQRIYKAVPSGLGGSGPLPLDDKQLHDVLNRGPKALVERGYGEQDDVTLCENGGHMEEAQADCVSKKAQDRGRDQLGTLGSGNHFLEIQEVGEILDSETAKAFGLDEDMITIMIHCGSRGLGHQICTDYVQEMVKKLEGWGLSDLPDTELACAPYNAPLGQQYYCAMSAAANFAWANRHVITHMTRTALQDMFGKNTTVNTVYDVCHNIGKKETHTIRGEDKHVIVHRKGATRAFGPHGPDVPQAYKETGHPVLIPGTMGTSSYVMVGRKDNQAFFSCCHGAGRTMSRNQARKTVNKDKLESTLESFNVTVQSGSTRGLLEEAPQAYKDVTQVVNTVVCSHLADPVARMLPRIVIKG